MVHSFKDTSNRTLGYNSCCALHHKSSCVFRVFITRHVFLPKWNLRFGVEGGWLVVTMPGGAEGGEGKGGERVPFLDTPPMSDYPTCGRTLSTPPPNPTGSN